MDNFHWILFSFCMTRSKVFVFDSLYKTTDKRRYQDVVELIKTAWTCLCDKYLGKFCKKPLCSLWLASTCLCLFFNSYITIKIISWLGFPICAGHDEAFWHQSMWILCVRVHAPSYSLRWWWQIRGEGACTNNCDYIYFLLIVHILWSGSYSFVHILW
jgi:hypothetical protein